MVIGNNLLGIKVRYFTLCAPRGGAYHFFKWSMFSRYRLTQKINLVQGGGVDTNWDGHHDGGDGEQFPLSENALSGWVLLNNLH